jgi:putative ABC transport system substrate-binding protein
LPAAAEKLVIALLTQQTEPYQNVLKGFQQSLKKQGINAEYEILKFDTNSDQGGKDLQAIKTKKPALVFTLGSAATEAAIQAIKDIPIIAGMIVHKRELQQAKNATGVILDFPLKTQLDWIRQMFPNKKTVGVLFNPKENQHLIVQARKLTKAMGLTLYAKQVESPRDLPDALDSLSRRADVVWGLTDSVALTPETAKGILLFSFRNRIPGRSGLCVGPRLPGRWPTMWRIGRKSAPGREDSRASAPSSTKGGLCAQSQGCLSHETGSFRWNNQRSADSV